MNRSSNNIENSDVKVDIITSDNTQHANAIDTIENPSTENKDTKSSESCLTDLLKCEHLQPIYNICWVIFIILALDRACHDYFFEGRIYMTLRTFKSGFTGIEYSLACWCFEHFIAFLVHYGFRIWCQIYTKTKNSLLRCMLNITTMLIYTATQCFIMYIATACCLKYGQPFPSAIALMLETVRIIMKVHAFVRTNTDRIVSELSKTGIPTAISGFSHYLYFLFAPTLIYRDNYPRITTRGINWNFVLKCVLEILGVMFLYAFLFERYVYVYFGDFGKTELTASMFIEPFFGMMLPGILYLMSTFYLVLHAVQNLFAELLYFGDRTFYKNWWSTNSYQTYFRTWNCVVQNWLHEYVYMDFRRYVCNSALIASIVVVTISAVGHEFFVGIAFQFFFPITYINFGILSVIMMYTVTLPNPWGNLFLWFSLIVGSNVMVSLYSLEYYASVNCPKEYTKFMDYVIPNIWSCIKKYQ